MGTCERRGGAAGGATGAETSDPVAAGLDPSRLVIVIPSLPLSWISRSLKLQTTKNPRLPARVPSVFGVRALAALVPPQSVGLPPGAGNKAEKAIQPKDQEPENADRGYVDQTCVRHGNPDAAAIARDDDGDMAAIRFVEDAQRDLP